MAVTISCPECAASFPVSEELLGKKMRCKGCQAVFVAAAAKVKVGAGAERPMPAKAGVNGVHKPTPTVAPRPQSESTAGNGMLFALVGGGVAFVLMAAVTAWAMFSGGGDKANNVVADGGSGNAAKINLNDTPVEVPVTPKKEDKGKPNEQKIVSKRIGPASFVELPATLPFAINQDVSRRVARSAAFIKLPNSTGSGWFAEPGIVITNSHVVGMKEPVAPPPTSIKVVIHSGTPEERSFDAELLGIDRDNDLAVLRVQGEGLPDPVPIARSSLMREGQKLNTVGFPKGKRYEKMFASDKETLEMRVKVRESALAGRFPTRLGSVKLLQIEGGADPGNSGGMIVDPGGHVRCVLVSGIGTTNMRFAIPSEYVIYLLQGRVLSLIPGQAYASGDKVKMPLMVQVADPMKRIKAVSLDWWAGDLGKRVRPATTKSPRPNSGDTERQAVALKYDANEPVKLGEAHSVACEVELTPLQAGHVYWVQPHYLATDGSERWGEAVALETEGLPVERKPAHLTLRHQVGTERTVDLETHFAAAAFPEGAEQHLQDSGLKLKLSETTQSVLADGSAKVLLKYKEFAFADPDEDKFFRTSVRGLLEVAKGMTAEVVINKQGNIKKPQLKLDKVPVPVRSFLNGFNAQTIQSLEALSLGLPDKEVQPGDKWQRDVNYSVVVFNLVENALFKLSYRYIGTRVRNGREEAIIEYDGNIVRGEVPPPDPTIEKPKKGGEKGKRPQTRGFFGQARGSAVVDVSTGLVLLARSTADLQFDVDFPLLGFVTFGGEYRVDLSRHLSADSPPMSVFGRLLPNQLVPLDPLVGSPDINWTD